MAAVEVLPSEQGFARTHAKDAAEETRVFSDEHIAKAHAQLVETFRSGRTKTYEWRKAQLEGLRRLCVENSEQVCKAIISDLGRPKMEAFLGDVTAVVTEIDHTLQHLQSWMQPEAVATPMIQKPGRSCIIREPKGVVLQIAPWNFPVNLSLMGLIAGLAAGNCCLLKPSEIAPSTEELLAKLLPKYVDPEAVIVINGGIPESAALLKLRWDHILYTGNGVVARAVARAAAEHLTPITLELGGKSPTIVLPGANIPVAARRILAGKFFNCGQICIAPDYALVHKDAEAQLVKEMQGLVKSWYGEDASTSDSFGRIINERHWDRVRGLIESSGAEVLAQPGEADQASKFIPPTLLRDPSVDSAIMQEEIFGPVLPILKMDSMDSMVDHINAGEKPLAMYIFGPEAAADQIIARTSSGGVCVNDTIYHILNPDLPFGGVGGSGIGRYHGKWGFDEFSHVRSVMYRATWLDLPQRYPPYSDSNLKMMEKLLVGPLVPPGMKKALAAVGGVAVAGAALAARSRL
mmetsp:Transcript_44415/g.117553  ORF Transcript_44415/g.117553 Transcript_44415/m.117553 type:complete len:520 (-) Transcript_44415:29-1588(-)